MSNQPFKFICRQDKPVSPKPGYFYWVKDENKIWFSPDDDSENMVRIYEKVFRLHIVK